VDLSRVQEGWNDKSHSSPWAPDITKLEARAKVARRYLRELAGSAVAAASEGGEEVHIVVVTHGGFVHFLTQDYDGLNHKTGSGW
jgi:broad specificity phosphatase PhoE